ncbi:unnamed protein product, partial [Phyllotreta striolata]
AFVTRPAVILSLSGRSAAVPPDFPRPVPDDSRESVRSPGKEAPRQVPLFLRSLRRCRGCSEYRRVCRSQNLLQTTRLR